LRTTHRNDSITAPKFACMGNASLDLPIVPFTSLSYHVLLYGINDVGPKLDDMMSEEIPIPILADDDGNLPMICFRRINAVNSEVLSLRNFVQNDAITRSQELSNALRFIDQNTLQPHYELTVINSKNHNPAIILACINAVVHMLRIRGFKFITPLILSKPYFEFFENPEKVMIANYEDVGLKNLDSNNVVLTYEDLEWVYDNISWFWNEQFVSTEFQLPLEMLYASIFSSSERARLASLWIGIESLIKTKDADIGKTVKTSLRVFGGISGNKAKNYWGDSIGRCRVIHGVVSKSKTEAELKERVDDVREVFCKMLQYFIERKIVPTEENVFGILDIKEERTSLLTKLRQKLGL